MSLPVFMKGIEKAWLGRIQAKNVFLLVSFVFVGRFRHIHRKSTSIR